MSTIKLKRSDVPGKAPLPGDLELGELAVNTADGVLYLKNSDGEVQAPSRGKNLLDNSFDANDVLPGERRSWQDSGFTEALAVSLNLPALGGDPALPRSWHLESMGAVSNRIVQYATEVFGQGTVRGRTFVRVRHDSTWYPWQEILSTSSTGTAATRDVGTATGNVMEVGAFGLGETNAPGTNHENADLLTAAGFYRASGTAVGGTTGSDAGIFTMVGANDTKQLGWDLANTLRFRGNDNPATAPDGWSDWFTVLHTGNILAATGQSTLYPMTQKATTDALATKAASSHTHTYLPLAGGTVTGVTTFSNTTNASNATNGAVRVSGGLSVALNIFAGSNITAYSDIRLKSEITKIDNALEKVHAISGNTYYRKDLGEYQAGVIAQEVEKVLPEVVLKNPNNGHLSVAYGNLSALLVEAIKELHEKQKDDVKSLQEQINKLTETVEAMKNGL